MPAKRAAKDKTKEKARSLFPEPKGISLPSVPVAAVLSFLKETRGLTTWPARLMADTLKINLKDAKQIISILELQGYVKPAPKDEWMTTIAGESVSGSKPPRYTRKRIDDALASLHSRIAEANRDSHAPFKIAAAIAFGDFLNSPPRVQAADVGVHLQRRKPLENSPDSTDSTKEHIARDRFLKERLGKTTLLHLRPFEDWMRIRTHRNLLG
jgi:hypothetical protein